MNIYCIIQRLNQNAIFINSSKHQQQQCSSKLNSSNVNRTADLRRRHLKEFMSTRHGTNTTSYYVRLSAARSKTYRGTDCSVTIRKIPIILSNYTSRYLRSIHTFSPTVFKLYLPLNALCTGANCALIPHE